MVEVILSISMLGSSAPSLKKLTLGTQPLYDEEEQATWSGHVEVFQWREPKLNSQLVATGDHTRQCKSIFS